MRVGRIERSAGQFLIEAIEPSHLAVTLTGGQPAARGLDRARGELRLHLFHLLLHPRSLLHQFSNA